MGQGQGQGQVKGQGQGQGQGLEFGGEVFFTNSLMPQALTSLHTALRDRDRGRDRDRYKDRGGRGGGGRGTGDKVRGSTGESRIRNKCVF